MTEQTIEKRKRVITPTVLQHEAVECGAASLTMVLHYYKCFVPLDEVRVSCGVSRDGSNAGAILKAANHYKLGCRGFRREPESLKKHPFPQIVFWQFFHFLVVEGYDENFFYLNDPALGKRKVTYEEFSKGFTGVVLIFEPGEDFKPSGRPPELIDDLKEQLTEAKEPMWFLLLTSLLLLGPALAIPALSRVFIDYFLIEKLDTAVNLVILASVLIIIFQIVLTNLQQTYLLRLRTKVALSAALKFSKHLLRLPAAFFVQRFEGSLVQQVMGNDQVANLLFGATATTFFQFSNAVVILLVMFSYDLRLTLVVLGLVFLNFLSVGFLLAKCADIRQKCLMDEYRLKAAAFSAIQSIETFKATGRDNEFFSRWAGLQAKSESGRQLLQLFSVIRQVASNSLSGLASLLIIWLGSLSILDGSMTIGSVVAFQLLAISFIGPVQQIMVSLAQVQEARGVLIPIGDTMRSAEDPRTAERLSNIPPDEAVRIEEGLQGYLELADISFGYAPLAPPLVQNFSLSLTPGKRVAIVGSSGSGKSTVAKLITGLFSPWSGKILFDGIPIEHITSAQLSRSLSYVGQDIFLFEGTVRDNLNLWDKTVAESDVVTAAKNAEIHDEIASRRDGYDCIVSVGGNNFSGGQAQRLEIARALVSKPGILVLDEATSALDPTKEEQIYQNLQRLGMTTIIIAHRLSAIRDCDEIIVLEHGKTVQRGTHKELIALEGVYKEMVHASG